MRFTNKLDAYRVYLIYAGVTSLAFTLVFTINMVYQVEQVGLDPLQLVLVGTVLETSVFLFEVPTGIVADVYSRRLSIIIGIVLIGCGFLVEGLIATFGGVLMAQVLWGIGYTFTSGATDAWLADEIGEANIGPAYLRGSQAGQAAGIIGIVLSVAIASGALNWAIVAGGLTFLLLAVFLGLYMPETGFQRVQDAEASPVGRVRGTLNAMRGTLRDGVRTVRGRPALLTILAAVFVYGAASESFDRLWTAHILDNFSLPVLGELDTVVWFGIISIVSMLVGLVFTEVIRRRVNMTNARAIARTMIIANALLVLLIGAFALSHEFWLALGLFWAIGPIRGLIGPLESAWINQGLDPKVRATVLSMTGQTNAIGQVAGGPVLGWVGRQYGVRTALGAGAIVLSPVVLLYALARRRIGPDVPPEAETPVQLEPV